MSVINTLYEKDFYAWSMQQARLIKDHKFDKLDIKHLFDEIEDMGNRHADEIQSRLEKLLRDGPDFCVNKIL